MTNLWVTFSTDSSGNFSELSGNIIYNVNNLYNFNGNLVDTSSNFIIYELSNNPIQANVLLQHSNWKQLNLNTNLNPFQGYWLGGINTNLPQIITDKQKLLIAVNNWISNPIPVANNYGLIENWDVGNVTNMNNMFFQVSNFNHDLNEWDVGNVASMTGMFFEATNFNGNISSWNVENVTNMDNMFLQANNFDGNISSWNVGNVTSMTGMFLYANSFNQDISNWDVGNVTDMASMFSYANSFNQDISNWDVGNVKNMSFMFYEASNFNGNISNWDVGNVTNMSHMFLNANSFNQDISNWDVGNVANGKFDEMFKNVTFFTDMSNQIHANGTPYNYFKS